MHCYNLKITLFFRKIAKGEEITTNYIGKMDNDVNRDQRRTYLFESHNFICACNGCDLSEKQLKVQNRLADEFERLMNKKNEVQAKGLSIIYISMFLLIFDQLSTLVSLFTK